MPAVFGVCLGEVGYAPPLPEQSLYPRGKTLEASPKAISGRTSYLRVRLAYHLYPQVIF